MARLSVPRSAWMQWLPMLLAGVLVGFLISTRATSSTPPFTVSRTYTSDINANTIAELQGRQHELKQQLKTLRDQQTTLQAASTNNQGNLEEIRTQIESQKQIAGLVPMRGPGIVVSVDDSTAALPADGVDVNNYIIHQQQLVALVAVLWNAGAEAISINDQRVTDQTSIYCVGSTVVINQELLAPPFTVRAIGDPRTLDSQVRTSPLLAELWERERDYALVVNVKQVKQVQVPAYTGSFGSGHLEVAP